MGLVRSALVTEEKCISQLLFWLISCTYSPSRQELASPGLLSHRFGQLGIAGQPAFRRDTFIFEMRPVFIRKSGTRETSSGWTAEVYFTLPRDKLRDVLTCITNHPYTNYEIETPPKKLFHWLKHCCHLCCIFFLQATDFLGVHQVPCVGLTFSCKITFISLILSSGTWCGSIKLYGAVVICVSPESRSNCLTIHTWVFSHLPSSILIFSLTLTPYYLFYLYSK